MSIERMGEVSNGLAFFHYDFSVFSSSSFLLQVYRLILSPPITRTLACTAPFDTKQTKSVKIPDLTFESIS